MMTFRKPALSVFASAAVAVTVIGMAVMVANDVQDLFAAAIVVSLFAYLFWLVGWHSAGEQVLLERCPGADVLACFGERSVEVSPSRRAKGEPYGARVSCGGENVRPLGQKLL